MIEKAADLGLREALKDLKDEEQVIAKIDEILKEKISVGLEEVKKPLIDYLVSHAEEISLELPNIVAFGDYGRMLEDNDSMALFLKKEASDPKHWIIWGISDDDKYPTLLRLVFMCAAVDDGDSLKGTVFVSKAGVVRHAFVQAS